MRLLRPVAAAVAAAVLSALCRPPPTILIEIDKSAQRMTVSQDGAQLYVWPVSTGQRGYDTPGGEFKPFRMEKDHFSREWDDAPMPHSIFFTTRGHAIHGTEHLRNIGRPASHGCVRLEPENARTLFSLVKQEGMANVRVVLFGATGPGGPAMARRAPQYDSAAMTTTSPVLRRRARSTAVGNPWGSIDDRRRLPAPAAAVLRPGPALGLLSQCASLVPHAAINGGASSDLGDSTSCHVRCHASAPPRARRHVLRRRPPPRSFCSARTSASRWRRASPTARSMPARRWATPRPWSWSIAAATRWSALRGDGSGPHTVENARRKAYTANTFRMSTEDFVKDMKTRPVRREQTTLPNVIAINGGVPIKVGNEVIGGIGLSGSPGKDEECVKAGLEKVKQFLQ